MQNLDFDLDYTYDGPGEETIPPAAVMIRTDGSGLRRATDAEQREDTDTSAKRSK
jgi:hypothetical protein